MHEAGDLRGRFGVGAAEKLLASPDPETRLRGLRRLAAIDTPQAIDLLVRSQDAGMATVRDPRARLEAIRGLAPHASDDGPRQTVLRTLAEASVAAEGDDLAALLRDTAALAIARFGGPRGTEALAGFVRQGGSAARAAAAALRAHPPEAIDALAGARSPLSPDVATLLGELGDLRAIPWLRRAVRQGEPRTRLAALVALARLGDAEAGLIARGWATAGDPAAKLAAALALTIVAPAEGRRLVATLLPDATTQSGALDLALAAPGPELAGALTPLVREPTPLDTRRLAIAALGRSGGTGAEAALAALLGDAAVSTEAGLALALMPGSGARRALEAVLAEPSRPRAAVALRAAAVRAIALSDTVGGARDVARAMQGTPAGAFYLVATGEVRARELAGDAAVVPAISRAVLARSGREAEELAHALAAAEDPRLRDALGVTLVASPLGGPFSTSALRAWVEEGGALAPLAARALTARDEAELRVPLEALARSGDPTIRAHVALGLGASASADAAGRLAAMLPFETDASVRRAAARSLAARKEPNARAALALLVDLDPDPGVRAVARAAIAGRPAPPRAGELVAWSHVTDASGATPRALRFERPDGLVVPVVPDDDGALLVPGLPAGISRASVAPAVASPPALSP